MNSVSTQDNPATQDVPISGDAATQTVQDYQNKYGPAPSTGESDSTPEPDATADETGQPEGGEPQPDDKGKLTRLEQDLAGKKRLLTTLGIDPDSDIAEKLNAGLITKEQLFRQMGVNIPQPVERPVSPIEKLAKHKEDVSNRLAEGGELTQGDFLKSLDIMSEFASASVQQSQQTAMTALYEQCRNATEAVINADQMHTSLPEDIQKIESQIFLSSTDNLLAQETGGNTQFLTPQAYSFYGQKNIGRLNKLRNHWIEHGKKLAQQNINLKPTINPLPSGTGGVSTTLPKQMIKLDNIAEAARNYAAKRAVV